MISYATYRTKHSRAGAPRGISGFPWDQNTSDFSTNLRRPCGIPVGVSPLFGPGFFGETKLGDIFPNKKISMFTNFLLKENLEGSQ